MTQKMPFEALSVETLPARLGTNEALHSRIGKDSRSWKVREVGDGNLNLVFIVEGARELPWSNKPCPMRLVGDSWPCR
jgi:5-methylthioribose kinase